MNIGRVENVFTKPEFLIFLEDAIVDDWLNLYLGAQRGRDLALFVKFESYLSFVGADGWVIHELVELLHIDGLLPFVDEDIRIFDLCLQHLHGLSHVRVHKLGLLLNAV
jgi:hypothetical protein